MIAAEPSVSGIPATWILHFVAVGTPRKVPEVLDAASACSARSRARGKSLNSTALSVGLTRSRRTMAASAHSAAVTSPEAIRSATPVASRSPRASSVNAWMRVIRDLLGKRRSRWSARGGPPRDPNRYPAVFRKQALAWRRG
ncbi:Uncharacterised protein [Mycobacteroides abscessus subsp. abscessus]|nr:Uncharacterised protein [Mycobacteroides abscessus subsp. abscessus]